VNCRSKIYLARKYHIVPASSPWVFEDGPLATQAISCKEKVAGMMERLEVNMSFPIKLIFVFILDDRSMFQKPLLPYVHLKTCETR